VQHLSRRYLVETADHRALPLGAGDVAAEAALLTGSRGGLRLLCCRSGTSIAQERTHRLAGYHVLMVDHPTLDDRLARTAPRTGPRITRSAVDVRRSDHPQDLLFRHPGPSLRSHQRADSARAKQGTTDGSPRPVLHPRKASSSASPATSSSCRTGSQQTSTATSPGVPRPAAAHGPRARVDHGRRAQQRPH
jgi:hypothetical protein